MFKLHIYNPEHDIALGKNDVHFTPPKAARLTRDNFSHIPVFWADEGDWILVDEPSIALSKCVNINMGTKVRFVTYNDLKKLTNDDLPGKIEPWGWDKHLVHRLLKCNPLFAPLVPSNEELENIRQMSSREFVAKEILPQLVSKDDSFVGETITFKGSVEELCEIVKRSGSIVLKSPWSCSGRGVKFITCELTESEKGWVRNILEEQGGLMIEPNYNNVLDFAMEFHVSERLKTKSAESTFENEAGSIVTFMGINIFETHEGKYIRNMGKSNDERLNILNKYIPLSLVEIIKEDIINITSELFCNNKWISHFGVDMMIVKNAENKIKVHPCVEMNLRRTMGQI